MSPSSCFSFDHTWLRPVIFEYIHSASNIYFCTDGTSFNLSSLFWVFNGFYRFFSSFLMISQIFQLFSLLRGSAFILYCFTGLLDDVHHCEVHQNGFTLSGKTMNNPPTFCLYFTICPFDGDTMFITAFDATFYRNYSPTKLFYLLQC